MSPVVVTTTAAAGLWSLQSLLPGLWTRIHHGRWYRPGGRLGPLDQGYLRTIKLSATAESAKKGTTSVDGTQELTQSSASGAALSLLRRRLLLLSSVIR